MNGLIERWKARARQLRTESYALYLACKDARTPWYAKLAIVIVVGYALSPVDLIPDFVPVLGYLDDLVLIPLGIAGVMRLIPADVMQECRQQARDMDASGLPIGRVGTAIIIAAWLILLGLAVRWLIATI